MCVLCERDRWHALGQDFSGFFDAVLAPASLQQVPIPTILSPSSALISQELASADGRLDLYLHAPVGSTLVQAGTLDEQFIQSVGISDQDLAWLAWIVARLDEIIDLDFGLTADVSQADIALYYDAVIDLGDGKKTLGLALSSTGRWELFVNYDEVVEDQPFLNYVNLHELGHALGLKHPFDATEGEVYAGVDDPLLSAYPEQTVMAYRDPWSGSWPDFFTTADLNALIEIWGVEQRLLTPFNDQFAGGDYSDSVSGLAGDDELIGMAGDDWLDGGPGNDVILGGEGADRFRLSEGFDFILDFSIAAGDRLELAGLDVLAVVEVDQHIHVQTNLGVTVLAGVPASAFSTDAMILL